MTVAVFAAVPLPVADQFRLDGPEGRHAAAVRRLRVGERLDVTDGAGGVAECVVVEVHRDALDCRVLHRRDDPEPTPRLVVVQALAKSDRGERAVELLTEVGADVVVPWSAHRSVVRWDGERGQKSRRRWESTAAEAAKQSRRTHWPVVTELASTASVAARLAASSAGYVLHEAADEPLVSVLAAGSPPARGAVGDGAGVARAGVAGAGDAGAGDAGEVVVVVGPEGGFAPIETDAFEAAGARLVRLGPTVLRTSTAGVVAATLLLAAVGRLGSTAPAVTTGTDRLAVPVDR